MADGTSILDLRDLRVDIASPRGTVHAVRGVSLRIGPGEVLGLVGESGSGKSMTGLSIAGLTPAAAQINFSRLQIGERVVARPTPDEWRLVRRDVVGFVFQNPMRALNPRLTIGNLFREAMPAAEAASARQAYRRSLEMMDAVSINRPLERLRQYPHELSGGLAQRVVIGLALLRRPKLLIADEPTTALDVSVQAQILDLIDKLKTEFGLAVLLVSHDLDVVRDRADRVAVMYKGEIVETGASADVIGNPQHAYTRALLAASPANLTPEPATKRGPAAATPIVAAEGVVRSFAISRLRLPWQAARKRVAVSDVSISIGPNESLGIVGESGSGKTTLARMLVGLDAPDSGRVLFNGRDVSTLSVAEKAEWRKSVQFVFQDNSSALDPRFTVGQSILEPLRAQGVPAKTRADALERVLGEVGLSMEFAVRRAHQLSGGQRQRVGIARALISNPRLIIADEPVSALDVSVQATILKLLNTLRREREMAYAVISHDIGVIRYVCSKVAVIYHGELVEYGPVETVLTNPSHDYTKKLLAAVPQAQPAAKAS